MYYIYGPNEYKINDRDIAPVDFSSGMDIMDLCETFKPDAIVFPEYASTNMLLGFFGDLSRVKDIPIISIEDVYTGEDEKWHLNKGIDYVISRVPVEDGFFSVPYSWLPWAADDRLSAVFRPWHSRYNKALFIGEGFYSQNIFYTTRKKAIYLLETNGLLDSFRAHLASSRSLLVQCQRMPARGLPLALIFAAVSTVGPDAHAAAWQVPVSDLV